MVEPVLIVKDLRKYFPVTRTLLDMIRGHSQEYIRAVDGISFTIKKGETLSLIGESGCGKTTTGRLVLRLEEPSGGQIIFKGRDITKLARKELRPLRRYMQMIYQDPYASLNPRIKIGDQIAEPLIIHGLATQREAREQVLAMLKRVGLTPPEEFYERLPHHLSGGQRQRVVIARAMILKPEFIVADEAVSMIDVSMRASILDLLESFRREYQLSTLFITHDIGVGRIVSNRIAVMYIGKIVEIGPTEEVINNPAHPYTKALIDAVPSIRRRERKRLKIRGDVPDPKNPPPGCRFHTRCPFATEDCSLAEPSITKVGQDHYVACINPISS